MSSGAGAAWTGGRRGQRGPAAAGERATAAAVTRGRRESSLERPEQQGRPPGGGWAFALTFAVGLFPYF